MISKILPAAVAAAALMAPMAVATALPTEAASQTLVAASSTTYGKVTARHMLTRSDLMFPRSTGWGALVVYPGLGQGLNGSCDLTAPSGSVTADWESRDLRSHGKASAYAYGSVAKAQSVMRGYIASMPHCSHKLPGTTVSASRMRLIIRMADAEVGTVYKVRANGTTYYEFVGAVRVGNRVETVSVVTDHRFSGDVSRFAYQMSLAARKLHTR